MIIKDELHNIPKDWDLRPFKSIIKFGKGLSITKENLRESGVQCLNYGEIHSKFPFEVFPSKDTLPFVSTDYLTTDLKALAHPGDIVFADTSEDVAGSGNFTQIMGNEPIFAGYHTVITRPNAEVNSRYIAYVLESEDFRNQIRSRVNGVKVYSITKSILGNTRVWLPDRDAQNSIAAYLDHQTQKISKLLREKQSFLELLGEKRQALISHYVTKGLNAKVTMRDSGVEWIGMVPEHWNIKKMKHIAKLNAGTKKPNLRDDTMVEFLPMTNVNETFGQIKEFDYRKYVEISSGYTAFSEGDVLFAKITPCMENGNCVLVPSLRYNVGFGSTEFIVFRHNKLVSPDYLYYLLRNIELRKICEKFMTGTAGQQRISTNFLAVFPVAIPPLEEQQEIVAKLKVMTDNLHEIEKATTKSILLLKEQRAALISAAVTGKIDVRNYDKTEAV